MSFMKLKYWDWDDAGYALLALVGVAVIGAMFWYLGAAIVDGNNAGRECREACLPRLSKIIDGRCHCATETAWERVSDVQD